MFVSPSNTETQGLSCIEARSQNFPVIGVNSRGVSDYIKSNINGLLANTLNPHEFEQLIELILTNPAIKEKIIINAVKTAQNFSYPGFKQQLLAAYDLGVNNWKKRGAK